MSCKTLCVVYKPPCLSCVVTTLKEHTDAVYETYIQFLRVIKYSLRTIPCLLSASNIPLGTYMCHRRNIILKIWPNVVFEQPTTVGNPGDKEECVAVVLWLGVQSRPQSFHVGCVGLQTSSWSLFFATRRINTWRAVAVIQGHTTGQQERQLGGCAKALGSSVWCIRCRVAYREAARLFRGLLQSAISPTRPWAQQAWCWC